MNSLVIMTDTITCMTDADTITWPDVVFFFCFFATIAFIFWRITR
jgi:hypothetical protein